MHYHLKNKTYTLLRLSCMLFISQIINTQLIFLSMYTSTNYIEIFSYLVLALNDLKSDCG